jgi:iron complex outermembrane receptor protein
MEFGQARDGSTTGLMVSQTEDVVSAGPFAQIGISPTDRVRFTGGVRWNYYKFTAGDRFLDNGDQSGDRNMDAVSPSVGVTVTAARNVNLFASVATAFETPTTVELSNTATGEGGFNQDLNPEDLTSFEFGIRGLAEPARLRYEVAFYTSNIADAFVPVQRPDDEVYQVNAGETSRKGLEMLLEWVPDSSFSARFAYTYQDFVFDRFTLNGRDYAGFLEPGAPPHRVFAGVTHRAPFGLTSIAQLRWVDEYTLNNANTAYNWAYTVVDLRFAFDGKGGDSDLRPFVGIDNLFGERYNSSAITNAFGGRYYEPSPGREVYVGMTVGFGIR